MRMEKIIIAPDSFKGTMSSAKVCEIIERSVRRRVPGAEVLSVPIADGGEGSVDAFLRAAGGEKKPINVTGPNGDPVEAFYGLLPDNTAVVEMAAAAGLPLAFGRRDPEKTTTYGVGQILRHLVETGVEKIIVGLGGSATNDGGAGAAAAAGVVFLDGNGKGFVPVGGTLRDIGRIDAGNMPRGFSDVEVITMCDIDNPLCGPSGAAAVFGPQKGADPEMVKRLDNGLVHLAEVVRRDLKCGIANLKGAGAAGGMGGGMAAFFGSRLQPGIETVLDTVGFDEMLCGADLVITGEGKLDAQSLRGKAVIGVARRAKRQNVMTVALVGDIGEGMEAAYDEGLAGAFTINRLAVPYDKARLTSEADLEFTTDNLMRFILWKRRTT